MIVEKVYDTVLLPSLYLAPISYYSCLFRSKEAIIEINDSYQKQSYRNRCLIDGPNGILSLNIPIDKPSCDKKSMKDIKISTHSNWQHTHWNAIVSTYNSSPFFEYYIDDFYIFYSKKYTFLYDLNIELFNITTKFLQIDTPHRPSNQYIKEFDGYDLREKIHPKIKHESIYFFEPKKYYQVFSSFKEFKENLSIIDLLFNMGNESRLYL